MEFILLIISYCIIVHPMICIFIILLSGWCGTRMRRARLVSNAFLYTTVDSGGLSFPASSMFDCSFLAPHIEKETSIEIRIFQNCAISDEIH